MLSDISVHFEKIHLSDRTCVLRDFKSRRGMLLLRHFMTISRAAMAILLKPLHWIACGFAMCLAVFLAGALILIEQKAARSRHTVA